MAIKIYVPTDSKQVFFDSVGGQIDLRGASRLSIDPNDADETFTIRDDINSIVVADILYSDIQNEAGAAAGATYADVKLYLAQIIG